MNSHFFFVFFIVLLEIPTHHYQIYCCTVSCLVDWSLGLNDSAKSSPINDDIFSANIRNTR